MGYNFKMKFYKDWDFWDRLVSEPIIVFFKACALGIAFMVVFHVAMYIAVEAVTVRLPEWCEQLDGTYQSNSIGNSDRGI